MLRRRARRRRGASEFLPTCSADTRTRRRRRSQPPGCRAAFAPGRTHSAENTANMIEFPKSIIAPWIHSYSWESRPESSVSERTAPLHAMRSVNTKTSCACEWRTVRRARPPIAADAEGPPRGAGRSRQCPAAPPSPSSTIGSEAISRRARHVSRHHTAGARGTPGRSTRARKPAWYPSPRR